MPRYLLLYRLPAGTPRPSENPDPETVACGKAQWAVWAAAAGPALVDFGAPTQPLTASHDAPWTNDETSTSLSGFTIVEADTEADLAVLVRDHPHRETGTLEVHALMAPPASGDAPGGSHP